jgi:hypothetical protein
MGNFKQIKKLLFALIAVTFAATSFAQTAKVQVIHNSADPAAANVAVWIVNGMNATKAIDNFEFREATGYVDVPAGTPIKIAFSAAGATSIGDTIPGLTTETMLMANESYIAMATGNIGSNFLPNPNSKDTKFKLLVIQNARQTANNSNNIEFVVVHGATDVPAVDVYVKGSTNPLVDGAAYSDATTYYSVAAQRYFLDITLDNSTTPLLTLDLDASGAAGATAVIFASGYLQTAANSNGEFVGFFVAFADGTVAQLLPPTTKLQVIHNSADPATASVDIYATVGIVNEKIVDDFEFRKATGFVDAPAVIATKISFAPANSNSIADTIAGLSQTVTLDTGKNYIAMAVGNVGTGFEANPDGENTGFRLLLVENARTAANSGNLVDLLVIHGSTDAPTVDVVVEANSSILVDNAKYGDATAYASVMPTTYRLLVQDSGNTATVASFDAPLGGFVGEAAVVFASGYLTPANDNNGPAFGLFAAVGDQVVALTNTTSVYEVSKTIEANAYPNPTINSLNVEFTLNDNSPATLEVFDNMGRLVATETTNAFAGTNNLKVNTSTFKTGVYFFTLKTKEGINTSRFAVSK